LEEISVILKRLLGLERSDHVTVVVVPAGQGSGSSPAVTAAIRDLGPTLRRRDVSPEPGTATSDN